MNTSDRYASYALCREMLETPDVVRRFDPEAIASHRPTTGRVMLTGEGSSRIFPAHNVIARARREGWSIAIDTIGATEAAEAALERQHVFIASNSGRTAEAIRLARSARAERMTAVVASEGTPLAASCDDAIVLGCGPEAAVAATKSVVEQALVYHSLIAAATGVAQPDLTALAAALDDVLARPVPDAAVEAGARASLIAFAGRNDGVAEELTLKTNEITRVRSDYFEGTYAVHGVEEVLGSDTLVVLIEPFAEEEETFARTLEAVDGLTVVAIASRPTRFPTLTIPNLGADTTYLQLAAGWSLLVEIGLARAIDLDRTERARKIGNEHRGG